MSIDYEQLETYCEDPREEIANLKSSVENHFSLEPDQPYRAKVIFYNYFGKKLIGVSSRHCEDIHDYHKALAEMMYAYSAFDAESAVLALDSNLIEHGKVVSSVINVYFLDDDTAHIVRLPYNVDSNKVSWIEHKFSLSQIDISQKHNDTQKVIEVLYVFTHLRGSPFSRSHLLSYYSANGFNFKPFKKFNLSYIDFNNVS